MKEMRKLGFRYSESDYNTSFLPVLAAIPAAIGSVGGAIGGVLGGVGSALGGALSGLGGLLGIGAGGAAAGGAAAGTVAGTVASSAAGLMGPMAGIAAGAAVPAVAAGVGTAAAGTLAGGALGLGGLLSSLGPSALALVKGKEKQAVQYFRERQAALQLPMMLPGQSGGTVVTAVPAAAPAPAAGVSPLLLLGGAIALGLLLRKRGR